MESKSLCERDLLDSVESNECSEISAKPCFHCGKNAEYQIPFLLQESSDGHYKLVGGVYVRVCQNCYSEKEAILQKKVDSSNVTGGIIVVVIVILALVALSHAPQSALLVIGCSIGAAQAAVMAFKSASKNSKILSLEKNSSERFLLMFGNVDVPRVIAEEDVIFDFELLKNCIANGVEITRERISKEISFDFHSLVRYVTLDSLVADISIEERNTVMELMQS